MPEMLLGDAESAESCSSCRWTGSKTYHRSLEYKKKKQGWQLARGTERVCVYANLDCVKPAERREGDEQVDGTRSPLGERVSP